MSYFSERSLENLLDDYYEARCDLDSFYREVPYWNEIESTRHIATVLTKNLKNIQTEIEERTLHE